MTLAQKIKKNEGFSSKVYEDTLGYKTIGYGFLLSSLTSDELALNDNKIEPMNREAANEILELKLRKLENEVFAVFEWLKDKPQNVQEVIIEMCYQMGVNSIKKFATTLHYIRNDEYDRAITSGMKSLWAKQTPNRAKDVLSGLLNTNKG